ncbi:energy transducer TonB, partial [Methylophaga sp. UBA3996]
KPVPPVSQPTKQEKPAEKLPDSPVLTSSNKQNVPQKTQSNPSELATETFSVEHYKPIEKQVPDYPRTALRKGLEGDCTVRYTVNKQGRVESPEVLADCHPMFERPSLAAAKTFRYAPRMVNGKAVPVPNVRNTFEYRIH